LVTLFSQEPFAGKDQSAICHDQQFANAIGDCLTAQCTVRQTLDFIKMSSAVCGIKPTNNVLLYRLTTLIMAGLALLFFALRITATVRLRLGWALDDTMAVASVVFFIPVAVIIQFMMENGLGVDLWYLSDHQITEGFRVNTSPRLLAIVCIDNQLTFDSFPALFLPRTSLPGRSCAR
jgi:hypothetical protein